MATTKPLAAEAKPLTPGKTLSFNDYFRNGLLNVNGANSTYAITAAGTTQATAFQLNSPYNEIDTAASGTGVNLPNSSGTHAVPYQFCAIYNNGANAVTVYAAQGTSDTINGVAGATGVTLAAGATALFLSAKTTVWSAIGVDSIPSALRGTFTANSGSAVTVTNANITANSVVTFGLKTVGGTPAAPFMVTVTPGTGFTVNSGGSDTSVYNYAIFG